MVPRGIQGGVDIGVRLFGAVGTAAVGETACNSFPFRCDFHLRQDRFQLLLPLVIALRSLWVPRLWL